MFYITGQIIKLGRSECLLAFGYTYNRKQSARDNRWRWYCSRYHQGCKAAVITTVNLVVTDCLGNHDHGPPKFFVSSAGLYTAIA